MRIDIGNELTVGGVVGDDQHILLFIIGDVIGVVDGHLLALAEQLARLGIVFADDTRLHAVLHPCHVGKIEIFAVGAAALQNGELLIGVELIAGGAEADRLAVGHHQRLNAFPILGGRQCFHLNVQLVALLGCHDIHRCFSFGSEYDTSILARFRKK